VPLETKPSAGQLLVTPSHDSLTSQEPALERQTVPSSCFWSAPQSVLTPSQ
jgi:hypothetical protein